MKYLNSLVFLGLMIMVAGCQKKDKDQPKKASHHTSAHAAKAAQGGKKGPTKLETKKSAAHKAEVKKVAPVAQAKADKDSKKAAPKKDMKKAADNKKN